MADTLPATPLLSYGIDCTEEYAVRAIEFGDMYSARATRGIHPVRQKWQLVYKDISAEEKETLRAFFNELKGIDYFLWTPIDQSTQLKFVTAEKGIRTVPKSALYWDMTVEIKQVFDP